MARGAARLLGGAPSGGSVGNTRTACSSPGSWAVRSRSIRRSGAPMVRRRWARWRQRAEQWRRGLPPAVPFGGSECPDRVGVDAAGRHRRRRGRLHPGRPRRHHPPRFLEGGLDIRGSSPHARGAVDADDATRPAVGVIPAAREADIAAYAADDRRVHPRMRGEQPGARPRRMGRLGSSQHARGAGRPTQHGADGGGFIPACAGSSDQSLRAASGQRVHPRVRGEQSSTSPCAIVYRGSSPHARGAGLRVDRPVAAGGFIPACAGSRACRSPTRWSGRVHPRMRGEQDVEPLLPHRMAGSSPHARGAAVAVPDAVALRGFIPACAARRPGPCGTASRPGVHPRMCGEQSL